MSDLAATNCGCGDERCGCNNNCGCGNGNSLFGDNSCNCILWIMLSDVSVRKQWMWKRMRLQQWQ